MSARKIEEKEKHIKKSGEKGIRFKNQTPVVIASSNSVATEVCIKPNDILGNIL